MMSPADKRAWRQFATRNFEPLAHLEARERQEVYRAGGPSWSWQAALALRAHLSAVRPDWPTKEELASDLDAAVNLAALLSRGGRALARR